MYEEEKIQCFSWLSPLSYFYNVENGSIPFSSVNFDINVSLLKSKVRAMKKKTIIMRIICWHDNCYINNKKGGAPCITNYIVCMEVCGEGLWLQEEKSVKGL